MEDSIKSFFEALSERNWDENDLSDFMFGLIKSSPEFRELFLQYVNTKLNNQKLDSEDFVKVEREVFFGEIYGRPDFKIYFKSPPNMIIEVKKWDTDYHFEKYNVLNEITEDVSLISVLTPSVLSSSTSIPSNWIQLTWAELVSTLENSNNEIIKGFVQILRSNLGMKKVNLVSDFSIANLLNLNRMIEQAIIERGYEIQSRYKNFYEDGTGYPFKLGIDNIDLYPWLGVSYTDFEETQNPFGLMFWLNDYHEHKQVRESLIKLTTPNNTVFTYNNFHVNLGGDNVVIMPLNKNNEWLKEFLDKKTVDDQKKMIVDFLINVISILEKMNR